MEILLSERIGFCFGVKRAVKMAEGALMRCRHICSLGSLIHNKRVVDELSGKGLKVVKDVESIDSGSVVISSHGIGPTVSARIKKNGIKIIDTTCPFVLKAQKIAKDASGLSYKVIIVGDSRHPEVRALVDFVTTFCYVVKDASEARKLPLKRNGRYIVISQTTQSTANFMKVVEVLAKKRVKEFKVINTICKDAEKRQDAAKALAGSVDLMLVVGGKNSANTKRLQEVCSCVLKNSHLVENEDDLKERWFREVRSIGITSGASTPEWVVKEVTNKIREGSNIKKGRTQKGE